MENKKCINCNTEFSKPYNESRKNWENRHKFCSRQCNAQFTWKTWKWKTQFVKWMVAPNKWRIYSEEEKAKMPHLLQKWHTLVWTEHLRKWRDAWNWPWNKGFYGYHTHWWNQKTTTNKAIRQSQKYLNWKLSIFKRDDYTCVICKKRSGNGKKIILHADHIKQFALIVKENDIKSVDESLLCNELWELTNWRTLCIDCHSKTDSYQKPLKV